MLLGALSSAEMSLAQVLDEPDLKKEQQLHRIYQQYYSSPTSNEKWNQALSAAKNQSYGIQKGDTLWDISQTLFGDPNFWPKIWSLNTGIYNPHEIEPSNAVQFSPGLGSEPPLMGVVPGGAAVGNELTAASSATVEARAEEEAEQTPTMTAPTVGQYIDIDLSQVKIPPRKGRSKSPSGLPNSLPGYVFQRDPEKDAVLELTPLRQDTSVASMIVSHFATDSRLVGGGEVLGTELGLNTAGQDQDVLVKSKAFTTGNRVMAISSQGKVANASGVYAYAVHGLIEIKEAVNSSEGIYRGRVVKSVSMIEAGDDLVLDELPQVQPEASGTMSPVTGRIIGGQFSKSRVLFGPYNIVYLDAGSAQGLSVGSHLPVYRNPQVRGGTALIKENPQEIGELQIVRVAGNVATAVIVRQLDDIRVGDVTSPSIQ